MRAILVVLLIATPSIILPTGGVDGPQIVALVSIFAALFTFVEYSSTAPSIIEFRDAPPFNRLRFSVLWVTVITLSLVLRGVTEIGTFSRLVHLLGERVAASTDFPFSPVRLIVLMMPSETSPSMLQNIQIAAGISYLLSLISIALFIILLRMRRWPRRTGPFNVWVNLPTFDPTAGGDVVARLNRDSGINLILGFLLPFLIPAVIKLISLFVMPVTLEDPQTMIWMIAAWAFLPASMLMRGVALSRVAQMIYKQRKAAYAKAAAEGLLPI